MSFKNEILMHRVICLLAKSGLQKFLQPFYDRFRSSFSQKRSGSCLGLIFVANVPQTLG
jgi:hypothetical protein